MDPEVAKEILLDHYKNPRNYGKVPEPSGSITENNPVCGDTVHISFTIESGRLKEVRFIGQGCSVSQAAASILTEYATGRAVEEVMSLNDGDFLAMIGFPLGPNREKCALLSLNALKKAIRATGGK